MSKASSKAFILLEAVISLAILTGCALVLIFQQQQLLNQSNKAKQRLTQSRIMYEEARIILRQGGSHAEVIQYGAKSYYIIYSSQEYRFSCREDDKVMEVQLEN